MNAIIDSAYIQSVDKSHRDKHGQFFTPPWLARFIVRWVLQEGPSELFDPAVGLASFQLAAREIRPGIKFSGCEKDSTIRGHLMASHPDLRISFAGSEYFAAAVCEQDAIVCNPPYMRFQNFEDKEIASAVLKRAYSERFSGFMNASSAFLLRSLSHLKPGGRLAYLMPLEFMAAGYGEAVKRILLNGSSELTFIRFANESEIFPEVLTSVGLVLLRKGTGLERVRFLEVGGLSDLDNNISELSGINVDRAELAPTKKWYSQFPSSEHRPEQRFQGVSLLEYGRFSRGIATGANEFFVLRPSEFQRRALPDQAKRICISRSQQVSGKILDERCLSDLIMADEPVYLLDLEASREEPVLRRIREGEESGVSMRYLTKQRRPWYRLESRRPAALLFGVFSRGGAKCVLNTSTAINLTPFHGFYPSTLGHQYLIHLWLFLNSELGGSALREERRIYGGKLDKFEPNDLNKVRVPSPEAFRQIPEELLQSAAKNLRQYGAIPEFEEGELTRYWTLDFLDGGTTLRSLF